MSSREEKIARARQTVRSKLALREGWKKLPEDEDALSGPGSAFRAAQPSGSHFFREQLGFILEDEKPAELSDEEWRALQLHVLERRSIRRVADAMQTTYGTTYRRITFATSRLLTIRRRRAEGAVRRR